MSRSAHGPKGRLPGGTLRLAFATIEYPPDPLSSGIGTYTQTVATQLAARGHRVFVVTRNHIGEGSVTEENGVTVYRLTPRRPTLPDNLGKAQLAHLILSNAVDEVHYRRNLARTLHMLVTEERVDLIEAADHFAEPNLYRPARHPHVPFVVRLHTPMAFSETIDKNISEPVRRGVGWFERNLMERATHLSAPSESAAEAFLGMFGLERPVAVFPNPTSYEIRNGHGNEQEDNDPSVLFVGRVTRWKGAHLLMKAVPAVLEQVPNARFTVAGSAHVPTNGFPSTEAYLLSLVPEQYQSRITFLGRVPHKQLTEYYERATVCVFPSLFEAFGYTCLEAMSLGKAVVGSRNGGMADLLENGKAGKLFTPPDVDELARHIVTLLQDDTLRTELGARALERVKTHYAPEVVMAQTEAFYRQTVAERAGASQETSSRSGQNVRRGETGFEETTLDKT